jgi:aspartate/methionine/tyrosine aminotransferase
MSEVFGSWLDVDIRSPDGAFYLWIDVDHGWTFAERLARVGGAIVSPGELYGAVSDRYVRVAVVQPDDRIELVAERLGVA